VASHYTSLGRDGTVIATFNTPFRSEYIAEVNNTQTDNPLTPPHCPSNSVHRLEGLTLDGGGGAYIGGVRTANASVVTFAADPFGNGTGAYIPHPEKANWRGAAMMLLSGKGAGQWRRVTSFSGREWEVDFAWAVVPDASTLVQVAPLRGHITLVANKWLSAYTVQMYAMCLNAVIAENTFDTTPLISWGRNPHLVSRLY
jgi:hypothetical protein